MKNRFARTGVVLMLALLDTACYKATGGGWIPGFLPGDRANFGFSARCKDTSHNGTPAALLYDGQLEWQDGSVRLHGRIESVEFPAITCDDLRETGLPREMLMGGTYESQDGGEPGTFSLYVLDNGQPHDLNSDFIALSAEGSEFEYVHSGEVQGGNIQVF
jgi:hypothetical protein